MTKETDGEPQAAPEDEVMVGETVEVSPAPPILGQPPSRDEIRAKIFGARPKTEIVKDFYGTTIELRQPSIAVTLETRQQSEDATLYSMLLDYTFVPGTNEHVFEATDIDNIKELPFGDSMMRLTDAVNKLLGVDPKLLEGMIKDAEKSPEG